MDAGGGARLKPAPKASRAYAIRRAFLAPIHVAIALEPLEHVVRRADPRRRRGLGRRDAADAGAADHQDRCALGHDLLQLRCELRVGRTGGECEG